MRAKNTLKPFDLAQNLTLLIALVVVRFYYHALFFSQLLALLIKNCFSIRG